MRETCYAHAHRSRCGLPGPRPPVPGPSELLLPGRVAKLPCPIGPGADAGYWFNPGLVEAWGKTWLVPRCNRQPSFLGIAELDEHLRPGTLRPLFQLSDACIAEDPRAIFDGRNVIIYYVGIDHARNPNCSMFRAVVNERLEVTEQQRLLFVDPWESHRAVLAAFGISQQKNWTPFLQDGREFCIYSHSPLTILERTAAGQMTLAYRTPCGLHWPYGSIRGGTPPVWHDGHWYEWFHSSRLEFPDGPKSQVNVYHVGVLVFDREFRPLAMTAEPLLSGRASQYTEPWNPGGRISACFPCGAVVRGDEWLVSYGWLDSEVRIAEIPLAEVDAALDRIEPGKN